MQKKPTSTQIAAFRRTVLTHFKKEGRHTLPWRATTDPYAIAVSEIMLQQTQAGRVVEKYTTFLKRFPTVQSLARAQLPAVLALWSGLGYNRRAKFLHQMAKTVVSELKGKFPRTAEGLEALPGIGPYTARAICAFAYNQPVAFIETNIRTVFIHHFFADAENISDATLLPIVEAAIDQKNPRQWYAALMDYGSALKQQGNRVHRKSKHYVRQSAFTGSTRQLRGAIIRSLLNGSKTPTRIIAETERSAAEVSTILAVLIGEKMIQKQGRNYALANQ
jgi:A/G-specific adenine glycosylase